MYRLLADHGHQMFPDGYLADLYTGSVKGRPTVAARVVATVMLLQAFEGLSDREAMTGLRWTCAGSLPIHAARICCPCRSAPRMSMTLANCSGRRCSRLRIAGP